MGGSVGPRFTPVTMREETRPPVFFFTGESLGPRLGGGGGGGCLIFLSKIDKTPLAFPLLDKQLTLVVLDWVVCTL